MGGPVRRLVSSAGSHQNQDNVDARSLLKVRSDIYYESASLCGTRPSQHQGSMSGSSSSLRFGNVIVGIGLLASLISIFSFATGIVSISQMFPSKGRENSLPGYIGSVRIRADLCTLDRDGLFQKNGDRSMYRCDFSITNEADRPVKIPALFDSHAYDDRGNFSDSRVMRTAIDWKAVRVGERPPDIVLHPGERVPIIMWHSWLPGIRRVRSLSLSIDEDSVVFTDVPLQP